MILQYKKWIVRCPQCGSLVFAADCADYCEYYEGDGKDENGVPCRYGEDK